MGVGACIDGRSNCALRDVIDAAIIADRSFRLTSVCCVDRFEFLLTCSFLGDRFEMISDHRASTIEFFLKD